MKRLAVGDDLGNNRGAGGLDHGGMHLHLTDEEGIRSEQHRSVRRMILVEE